MTATAPDDWLREARVRVFREGELTHVRLRGFSPLMAFVATLSVAVVVCGFAYPILAMLYHPQPVPIAWITTLVVVPITLGLVLAWRRRAIIASGHEDLVIDDRVRTIMLPWVHGRVGETIVRFEQITEIDTADVVAVQSDMLDADSFGPYRYVRKRASPDDTIPNVGHRSGMRHAVLVCWHSDDAEIEAPIVSWSGLRRVRALTFWLRHRLGME